MQVIAMHELPIHKADRYATVIVELDRQPWKPGHSVPQAQIVHSLFPVMTNYGREAVGWRAPLRNSGMSQKKRRA